MDIAAHALWVGIALAATHRRRRIAKRVVAITVGMAVLPDLVHLIPMLMWSLFGDGSLAQFWHYAVTLPGQEPNVPPTVTLLTHHLHCILHSAVIAGLVSPVIWWAMPQSHLPLLAWWSHILIDIPTHSADFFPSPVLYPITQRGFDGLAWNTPWFVVINYSALVVLAIWLLWVYHQDKRHRTPR